MIVLTETLKYFIQRYFSIEIDKYQNFNAKFISMPNLYQMV